MFIIKETFKGIYTGVIFVLLPLVVFTVFTSKFSVFGIKSYIVQTGSMEPTIPTASVIYTLPNKKYNEGDIIAFKNGDITITHRIIGAQNEEGKKTSGLISPLEGLTNKPSSFVTKGDANKIADSNKVSKNTVVGKVIFHFPYIGKFINNLKSPLGFFLAIILPTLGFILMELWNIKKEVEKETEKKVMERMGMT